MRHDPLISGADLKRFRYAPFWVNVYEPPRPWRHVYTRTVGLPTLKPFLPPQGSTPISRLLYRVKVTPK